MLVYTRLFLRIHSLLT